MTYTQEPAKLIAVLQMYITNKIVYTESQQGLRSDADRIMYDKLKRKFLKRKLFKHVLTRARYLVSNRENLRYYRTKGFGLVRKMMTAFGQILQQQGIIENADNVFYLQLQELEGIANKTLGTNSMTELIAQRKKDYILYESLPLPERIITYGKQELILAASGQKKEHNKQTELQGIPCSAGVVKAKVRKL